MRDKHKGYQSQTGKKREVVVLSGVIHRLHSRMKRLLYPTPPMGGIILPRIFPAMIGLFFCLSMDGAPLLIYLT